MDIIDLEKLIKHHMVNELYINVDHIEHFSILSTFVFPKNDCHTIDKYPIVEKDILLVETEYYINNVGFRRIYAIEGNTNRRMDVDQDILELILKTNKRLNGMQDDINHLDYFKADNKNIVCQKVIITDEGVDKDGFPKPCAYTLPSRRKAEILKNNSG